ncbi:MAG: sigma-70 family RNA polymerase sigma factor [Gemmataceae bacterium]
MSSAPDDPVPGAALDRLVTLARQGSSEALGQILESCRQYLLLVANELLDFNLREKVGASDLVQDTFLEAQRDFGGFHGDQEEELLAWLRRILLNNLADARRRYQHTDKRDVEREFSFHEVPPELLQASLAQEDSPRAQLIAREITSRVQECLAKLPEADQQVLIWRNYDLCSFAEIGRRLGKTEEAARKVWIRAVEQLEQLLGNASDSG